MLPKLGRFLYWTGCVVAGLIVIFVAAFLVLDPQPNGWSMARFDLGVALGVWLLGLVLRYLLSGR
jgi:hypothetical protein